MQIIEQQTLEKEITSKQSELNRRLEQTIEAVNDVENAMIHVDEEMERLQNEVIPEIEQAVDSAKIPSQVDPPYPIPTSKLWWDTSVNPPRLKRWNSEEWVVLAPSEDEINLIMEQMKEEAIQQGITYTDEEIRAARQAIIERLDEQIGDVNTQITDLNDVKDNLIERADNADERLDNAEESLSYKLNTIDYNRDKTDILSSIESHTSEISALSDEINLRVTREEFENLEIGGVNLFRPSLTVNLIPSSSGSFTSWSTGESFYFPVKSGEVYSFSRSSDINDRFRIVFSEEEPSAGVDWYSIDTNDSKLKVEGVKVPEGINYILLYLRYNEGELPNIQIEKGSKATSYAPAPEDALERITKAEANIAINSEAIALKAEKSELLNYVGKQEYTNQMGELNVAIDGITSRVSSTEAAVNRHTGEIESARSQIATIDTRVEGITSSVSDISRDLTTANQNISRIDQKADGIIQTVSEVRTDISGLEGDMTAVQTRIEQLPDEIDLSVREGIEEIEAKFGNLVKNPVVTGNHTGWSGASVTSLNDTFEGITTRVLRNTSTTNATTYSEWFDVDPSKAYEISMWVRKSAARGRYYVGLHAGTADSNSLPIQYVNNSTGVVSNNATNFYFRTSGNNTSWLKIVGYIMPSGTTPASMRNIGTNVTQNAILDPRTKRVRLRLLNYENGGTTTYMYVAQPKVVEISSESVNKTNVLSSINLSTEGVKIQGNKIDIVGLVSVLNADGTTGTMIQGGKIVGQSITANQLNINNIFGNSAVIAKIQSDSVRTAKLSAGQIDSGTINAARIGAQSITSSKIAAGAITTQKITTAGLDASVIKVGELTGIDIVGARFRSASKTDYMEIVGGNIELSLNNGRKLNISPAGFYGYNAGGSTRFQADSNLVTSAALGTSNLNVYLAADDNGSLGEVRAVRRNTLGGSGDPSDYSYINVRMRGMKSPPGANAYVGTDGELRVMSEGLISQGVYRDVRASKMFANQFEVNGGDILYLRSNDRVRVVRKGTNNTSTSFTDLEARDIIAHKFINREGVFTYIGSDLGLRVTSRGTTSNDPLVYRPVQASDFQVRSSRTSKKNITKTNKTGLDVIKSLKVVDFHMKEDSDTDDKRIGFIAEDSSDIANDGNDFISLKDLTTYLTLATQEIDEKLEEFRHVYNNVPCQLHQESWNRAEPTFTKLADLDTQGLIKDLYSQNDELRDENKQLKSRLDVIEQQLEQLLA